MIGSGRRIEHRHGEAPVAGWRWGEGPPALVFAHATGLCASIYAELLQPLARDGVTILAPDARGHGQTRLPADAATPPRGWHIYAQDLADFVTRLEAPPLVLAGHSMGGSVAIQAAALIPNHVSAVVAIDPALVPLDQVDAWRAASNPPNPMAAQAARRRPSFPDRVSARAAYAGRGAFAGWPDHALDAYLDDGLVAGEDGGVRLACTPEWEAATFASVTTELLDIVPRLPRPITFLSAADGGTLRPADGARLAAFHPESCAVVVEGGHFVPIVDPDRVRPWLAELLSRAPVPGGSTG